MTQLSDIMAPYRKTTLDNGMRVLTSLMPHTRSVSINLLVGVGSRYESDENAGISHLLEHLVFKGTAKRPDPIDISGAIEGVGGVLNAGTEQEVTDYWCKVAQPHMAESLDLLLDMMRNSVYLPEEIDRERMVVIEEQGMVHDQPSYKVEMLIDEMLWPDHPLGRDISGTRDSILGITREMVLEHVETFYTPANIVVTVAGNVDHDAVVRQVEEFSRGWMPREVPAWSPFTFRQSQARSQVEYRKTEQVNMSIAVPGVSMTHPDQYAVDLVSAVLGEGMSSRLFIEVREKRGLAYDVHTAVAHFRDTGAFVVNAGVDPSRVYNAVDTILAEVGKVREGVPEEELERAKRMTIGRMMLRMEDTKAVSSWLGSQELLLGFVETVDEVAAKVEAVTTEDVRRVARDLFHSDRLNMAMVGPCRGKVRLHRALRL